MSNDRALSDDDLQRLWDEAKDAGGGTWTFARLVEQAAIAAERAKQVEPALRLTVTVDDSNPLDRHHFELVWLQTPHAAGEYLYYAAPPAVQTVSGGRRILLARFAKRRHKSPPAMWYEWDGPDRASDHEYRYATLDEEAK